MPLFSKEPIYIGIEATPTKLRIVALQRAKKRWNLLYTKEVPVDEALPSAVTIPLASQSSITSVISQRQVMVRKLPFDLKKEQDVAHAIPFQMEPHLPFALEEALLQSELERNEGGGWSATIHSLKKSFIKKHLEALHQIEIEPDQVTSHALALTALFAENPLQEALPQFLVYVGEEETVIVLVKAFRFIDQRSFVSEKQGIHELHKALLSLENQYPKESCSSLLLFGNHSQSLIESVQETTGKTIHIMRPPVEGITPEELVTFAIPLGAAFSQAKPKAINFRQKEYQSSKPHKFIKKPLLASLALTALAATLLLTGGTLYINQKKAHATKQLSLLLSSEEESGSSMQQTPEEFIYTLEAMKKRVLAVEGHYTVEARVPKVSELLHFLSEEISKAPPPLKGLLIDQIHYQLIKRPTPLMTEERYLVQVELLFSSSSPNSKEALKELLQNHPRLIESVREVTLFEGKGSAQFTLKDKTHYG